MAAARDTSIRTYRSRRDFAVTAEPAPKTRRARRGDPIFVVQQHDARSLHWDFRLEHGGVLWSWAVPKGPSMDPGDKRLAVHVEDHPLDYATFHGTIPEGQYGAGTVEIWDHGTWAPVGDPAAGLKKGELKFTLSGKRLTGGFVLIRLKPRPKDRAENWLMIKEHDGTERADAAAGEGAPPATKKRAAKKAPAARPRAVAMAVATPRRSGEEGVHLTHPDRELWPGITKADLAQYWRDVAAFALPDIAGRPLALVRCPDGIGGEHFFQKHAGRGMPAAIRAGDGPFVVIDDAEGLIACAQMSAIELHAWGAREGDIDHPDRIVFDLDPGEGVPYDEVVKAALDVRERLAAIGLASFCRTTGGHGLHVVAPLTPRAAWPEVRDFCHGFAETMSKDAPDRFLAQVSKAQRRGRILVDWLRNGEGATAVASLSPRARPGATVATPLAWREVKPGLDPAGFTIATVPARLKRRRADPWAGFSETDQTLPHRA